jgi:hypothetical protein
MLSGRFLLISLPEELNLILKFSFLWVLCCYVAGCAPHLFWIHESSSIPSCQPDRLPQWHDYIPRFPDDQRGAETAIRFHLEPSQRKLRISFDHEHSWVKPDLIDPKNAALRNISERLLAHEQVHFLISCLVVRQTNLSITEKDDLMKILEKVKVVTQRLNLQYDAATRHGQNVKMQHLWEAEVMRQFQQIGVQSTASEF